MNHTDTKLPLKNKYTALLLVMLFLVTLGAIKWWQSRALNKDDAFYALTAARILSGEGLKYPVPIIFIPPFYPFLVAVLAKLTGNNLEVAGRMVSLLAWSLTGTFLFTLLRKSFSNYLAIFGLFAWSSVTIEYSSAVLTEATFSLLVLLMFLLVLRIEKSNDHRFLLCAIIGILGGMSYLTRPEGMLVFFVAIISVIIIKDNLYVFNKRMLHLIISSILFLTFVIPYVSFIHDVTGEWKLSGKQSGFLTHAIQRGIVNDISDQNILAAPVAENGIALFHYGKVAKVTDTEVDINLKMIIRVVYANIIAFIAGTFQGVFILSRRLFILGIIFIMWYLYLVIKGELKENKNLILIELLFVSPILLYFLLLPRFRYMLPFIFILIIFMMRGIDSIKLNRNKGIITGILILHFTVLLGMKIPRGEAAVPPQKEMGLWMKSNIDGIQKKKIMSREAGAQFYAGTEWYMMVYLETAQKLIQFMRKYNYDYIILEQSTTSRYYPQYISIINNREKLEELGLVRVVEGEKYTYYLFQLQNVY